MFKITSCILCLILLGCSTPSIYDGEYYKHKQKIYKEKIADLENKTRMSNAREADIRAEGQRHRDAISQLQVEEAARIAALTPEEVAKIEADRRAYVQKKLEEQALRQSAGQKNLDTIGSYMEQNNACSPITKHVFTIRPNVVYNNSHIKFIGISKERDAATFEQIIDNLSKCLDDWAETFSLTRNAHYTTHGVEDGAYFDMHSAIGAITINSKLYQRRHTGSYNDRHYHTYYYTYDLYIEISLSK